MSSVPQDWRDIYIYIYTYFQPNTIYLDIRYGRIYGFSHKETNKCIICQLASSRCFGGFAITVFRFSRVIVFACTRARTKVQGESVCDGLCNDALGDSSPCVTEDRPSIRRRRGSSPHRDRLHLRIQLWLEGRFRRPEAEPEEVTRSRRA